MITMNALVKIKPEKKEEFLQAIRILITDKKKQEGLIKFILYQEVGDQTGFSLIYEWQTPEDCERYLQTEEFRILLGALKVLGEKSEIRYHKVYEKISNLYHG